MPPIRVVTDSSARFIEPSASTHPLLKLAPVTIRWGDESLVDDPELGLELTRGMFQNSSRLPASLAPTPAQFEAIFGSLQDETDQIVSIHTSSGISQSYQNALAASESFRGRCDIQVIDSHSASAGLGLLAMSAADAAERGAEMEDLVRLIRGMIARLYMVLFLDDLAYLERNGLISRSQSILGTMLGIIPFLTMEHGQLIPMEKVRTRPRALEKLIEFVAEFAEIECLMILQRGIEPDEEASTVAERLAAIYADAPIHFVDYGPALATHVGANGLGVVVLESAEELL